MKYSIFIALALVAYLGYAYFRMAPLLAKSKELVAVAQKFERIGEYPRSMLVIGDSTAASVGSASADSVPGRVAAYLNARVENYAVSGSQTKDLAAQLSQAREKHYDVILIQIGANDVVQLSSINGAAENIDAILREARTKTDTIVLLTAGKIGDALIFPLPARLLLNHRTAQLRDKFRALAEKYDAVYADIYARKSPFESDPDLYYAADYFHPSGEGYRFWFDVLIEDLKAKKPDFK